MPNETTDMYKWDFTPILREFIRFVDALPESVLMLARDTEFTAPDNVENALKQGLEKLRGYEETVNAAAEKAIEASEAQYKRIRDARERVNQKIEQLPKLEDVPDLPYHLVKLVEIADTYKDMTDEQWQRVVDLAGAFAKK